MKTFAEMVGPMNMRGPCDRRAFGRHAGISLVELLISIVIMSIVSTMVLMGWFSLSKSYSFSVSSNVARDSGRQAISRMEREIRDMESSGSGAVALEHARPFWIAFNTTFNDDGSSQPGTAPHFVVYRLYSNGQIWRFEDQPKSGVYDGLLDNVELSPVSNAEDDRDVAKYNLAEQSTGEGRMLLTKNISNVGADPSQPKTLFSYTYYDSFGMLTTKDTRTGDANRQGVQTVQIHLLVDLNPSKSPVYADLLAAAQLRNQRGL